MEPNHLSPTAAPDPAQPPQRLVALALVYISLLILLFLLPAEGARALFLRSLMLLPILYAAFSCRQRIYIPMTALAVAVELLGLRLLPGGSLTDVAWIIAPIIPVLLIAEMIYRLVRQREAVERELHANQERYQLFVTRFQGVAIQASLQGQPLFLHGAVEDMTGYTREDFLERRVNWFDLVLAEDLPAVAQMQEGLRTVANYFQEMEYRVRATDGRVHWVHELTQNVADAAGRPHSILSAIYDVTEAHEAQHALRASEQRFRGLFETMQEGFALFRAERDAAGQLVDLRVLEANSAFERTFRLLNGPLAGKSMRELMPDIQPEWWQAFRVVVSSGQPARMEGFSRRLGRHLEVRMYQPAPDQLGTLTTDITERKEIERALQESQAHFRSLFDNTPVPLWDEDFSQVYDMVQVLKAQGVTDFHAYFDEHPHAWQQFTQALIVNDANRAALELTRMSDRDTLMKNLSSVLMRGHHDGLIEQVSAIAEGRTYLQWEGLNDERDGELRYHRITWSVAPGAEHNYSRVIVAIDDVTDSKRTVEALVYLSTHDTLTGLYNRAYFDTEIQRLSVGRNFPVSIVFADMDGLKGSNDTYGHAVGDDLLRRAAAVLRSAFRAEDVVARIGGDEFGVLLPGASAEVARAAMQRVEAALTSHNQDQSAKPAVNFSMGVAEASKDDDLNETLKLADADMYRQKAIKRG